MRDYRRRYHDDDCFYLRDYRRGYHNDDCFKDPCKCKDRKHDDNCFKDPCKCKDRKKERGLLSEFQAFTLPVNRTGGTNQPILVTPAFTELGRITLNVDDANDRVWLNATVGVTSAVDVIVTYKIYRNVVLAGTEIFSANDEIEGGGFDNFDTNHFSHVDQPPVTGTVTYILTAEANVAGAAATGPITFTGAEIEANRG